MYSWFRFRFAIPSEIILQIDFDCKFKHFSNNFWSLCNQSQQKFVLIEACGRICIFCGKTKQILSIFGISINKAQWLEIASYEWIVQTENKWMYKFRLIWKLSKAWMTIHYWGIKMTISVGRFSHVHLGRCFSQFETAYRFQSFDRCTFVIQIDLSKFHDFELSSLIDQSSNASNKVSC